MVQDSRPRGRAEMLVASLCKFKFLPLPLREGAGGGGSPGPNAPSPNPLPQGEGEVLDVLDSLDPWASV